MWRTAWTGHLKGPTFQVGGLTMDPSASHCLARVRQGRAIQSRRGVTGRGRRGRAGQGKGGPGHGRAGLYSAGQGRAVWCSTAQHSIVHVQQRHMHVFAGNIVSPCSCIMLAVRQRITRKPYCTTANCDDDDANMVGCGVSACIKHAATG